MNEIGKSCLTKIFEVSITFNAEGQLFWKRIHMQPIYRMNPFVTTEGNGRGAQMRT